MSNYINLREAVVRTVLITGATAPCRNRGTGVYSFDVFISTQTTPINVWANTEREILRAHSVLLTALGLEKTS